MMLLVDTNILIAVLRTGDPQIIRLLSTEKVAICGVVQAELLCGARSPTEIATIHQLLASFALLSITDALWPQVGEHLAALRSKGVTAPFPDVVLATLAMSLDIPLWTCDQHFRLMQQALPTLKLFQEP